jgi:hypothetical protein
VVVRRGKMTQTGSSWEEKVITPCYCYVKFLISCQKIQWLSCFVFAPGSIYHNLALSSSFRT